MSLSRCTYLRDNLLVKIVYMDFRKMRYVSPSIIKTVSVEIETGILASSTIQPDSEVKTTGQEVVSMDFSQSSFNQDWDRP